MAFFGFGKKKKEAADDENLDKKTEKDTLAETEVEDTVENQGPWDIEDENVPDYDEYLNMGALYLPFLFGIELRLKATNPEGNIISTTITYKNSSLEMEVFAAPKSMGLWDDIRQEFLDSRSKAEEVEGRFGQEIILPVQVKGKEVTSRIVGVDGPRWMIRAIFTGPAAEDAESEEKEALENFFSQVVVNRGSEPLAPRDRVFLSRPLTPAQMKEQEESESVSEDETDDHSELKLPDDPSGYDQQSQVQHTLRRGPLFSEMR